MLAPVLAFTADEAWAFVPGKTTDSVHELGWQPTRFDSNAKEQEDWKVLFKARESVLPQIEKARQSKLIGKALETKVQLSGHTANSLVVEKQYAEALRELLNVSQLEFTATERADGAAGWTPVVTKADGQKCERCWHWETDVGSNPDHPTICGRCVQAITEAG